MTDHYFVFKALHIITVVTWFAGLFYLPRLFVYFSEAESKPTEARLILQEQFKIMQRRLLFGITIPSSILAPTFAGFMLSDWNIKETPWLRIKLWLVVLLYLYQFFLHYIYLRQKKGEYYLTGNQLRFINELPTLLLVAIIFLVVMKDTLYLPYALVGIVVLAIAIVIGIKCYKFIRKTKTID